MSSIKKNIVGKKITAKKGLKVGIVQSEYNSAIGDALYNRCIKTLLESGVSEKNIKTVKVPGAFEIPFICLKLALSKKLDVIITLGSLIEGETPHFDYIASSCAQGIMDTILKTDVPIVFGVLTTKNMTQAKARIAKGTEAALTALHMTNLNI